MTIDQLISALQDESIDFLHVGIFDLDASFRERRLPTAQVIKALNDQYSFVDVLHHWDTSDSVHEGTDKFVDEPVEIDSSTLRGYPFEPNAGLLIADFAGRSGRLSPRRLLQTQVERAANLGFNVQAALEFEFIVLDETSSSLRDKGFENLLPYPRDNRCWSGVTAATHAQFVADLDATMREMDVPLYSLGLELGPGCFEATLEASDAVRAGDDASVFKLFTKAFCRQQDLTASFMAQLSTEFPGLSGHVHLSLTDAATGEPVFWDAKSPEGVSPRMQHFIGGMLQLMPDTTALVAHTVNAYRRMVPGNWAPRTPTWGVGNYTTAIRAMTRSAQTARVEYRVPAADTNPYLALAATLATGLWGIENEINAPPPISNVATTTIPDGLDAIPENLAVASARLNASTAARALFGDVFIDHFVKSRNAEVAAFRKHVSAFERARYLEAM